MLTIGGKSFSEGHCLIVAEVAQSHDGSLGLAHSFIDAVADSGADAVKFQTHIAEAESTTSEPWRVRFSPQDSSRYEYWKRMEFSREQWAGLRKHAEERGILFLSSPFSMQAVELLQEIGMPAWKIASGEASNEPLLKRLFATGVPVLLSTGMSSLKEIDSAVALARTYQVPMIIMQCSSIYPCPPEKVGLNLIPFFKQRYDLPVGLSDHSGVMYSGLAAAAVGIHALEVHVTFSKRMFGPDVAVSLTMEQLTNLVEGVRFIEKMRAGNVNKDLLAEETSEMRSLFTKSIVAGKNLTCGTILRSEDLALKKPGNGMPASRLSQVLGARLTRDLKADEMLTETDLEFSS